MILGDIPLTKIKLMYPDCDTLSNAPGSGYITACDQSMVESGVTEGKKNTASFLSRESTHYNTTTKPQAKNDFQSHPRRGTAASVGKRCR